MRATAAKGRFPYNHRTVAEVDAAAACRKCAYQLANVIQCFHSACPNRTRSAATASPLAGGDDWPRRVATRAGAFRQGEV